MKLTLKKKGIVIFKHRSFFSYLGAHRYASIVIPWGHIILNENQYKKFIKKNYKDREKQMINFFYTGLNYPRSSVSDLIKFATKHDFRLKFISIEPPHYNKKTTKFIKKIKNFWKIVKKNYPNVPSEEVLSGMYHIVLEKN